MSMADYAVHDYGMLLDEDIVNDIASQIFEDYTENSMAYWGYELYDKGICEYISEFTGEAQEIDDNGTFAWGSAGELFNGDNIAYVPLCKYPTLFSKAYNNMEEIIKEFKTKLGKYLPENFDYRSRIRHICGTYYG